MDKYDIKFITEHLDMVYEGLAHCEDTFAWLLIYLETYVETSTIDRAIIKSIKDQMITIMNLIQTYDIELKASEL